ncbi:hypothetical protein ACFVQ9_26085 [Streptomyces goshikiensis]|uniref:hypothetical protein n=1 Tax=Streptomyces goshikiensis TaxID=1942 RepID=UPI003696B5FE
MTSSNLMSLSDWAAEIGVPRQTVQRWHRAPAGEDLKKAYTPPSPLKAVAKAMKVAVPDAEKMPPRYPRSVYVAYCQAVGIMDEYGDLVPEIKARFAERKRGPWLPAKPTLDPGPGRRRRYYKNHVAESTGLAEATVKAYMNASPGQFSFPLPDGHDEMARPFYFAETFAPYRTRAQRKARMQPAEGANESSEAEAPADNA